VISGAPLASASPLAPALANGARRQLKETAVIGCAWDLPGTENFAGARQSTGTLRQGERHA